MKINALKDMEDLPTVHAVKNVMDELNYLAYTAINTLHEKIGADKDLEFFFRDIYPGQLMSRYRVLFGDPNKAIIRKRYMDESTCTGEGGESTFAILDGFRKQTDLQAKVGSISAHKPVTPKLPPSVVPEAKKYLGPKELKDIKYSGILINDMPMTRAYSAPLFVFEDAKVTRNMENPNYV